MSQPTIEYRGDCHCGSVTFNFSGPQILDGMLCDCSMCQRKGALLSSFTVPADELHIEVKNDALATYQFGTRVAKHQFCRICGIAPFVATRLNPGAYRINLGCVAGLASSALPITRYDGKSI